jgi:hypothetical protein
MEEFSKTVRIFNQLENIMTLITPKAPICNGRYIKRKN